jgi:hypothetical protein
VDVQPLMRQRDSLARLGDFQHGHFIILPRAQHRRASLSARARQLAAFFSRAGKTACRTPPNLSLYACRVVLPGEVSL